MSIADYVEGVNRKRELGNLKAYTIVKEIGNGSYATVYEVTQDGAKYALRAPNNVNVNATLPYSNKTKDSEEDEEYRREAELWANLSDSVPDDVVCMIDYNIKPFPWVIMELADYTYEHALNDDTANVEDLIPLLKSLGNIHKAGVIHRDIKPGNILYVDGKWKFSDFGLSKKNGFLSTGVNLKGTPQYMAPEQLDMSKKDSVGICTDIWQMGILLYQILTGKTPFSNNNDLSLISAILNDDPDMSQIDENYRKVVSKALSKKCNERYQTANDFATALSLAINGDEILSTYFRQAGEYENGNGVKKSPEKAFELYKKAADMGHVLAKYHVALLYLEGKGVRKSLGEAIHYLVEAAEAGNNEAGQKLMELNS